MPFDLDAGAVVPTLVALLSLVTGIYGLKRAIKAEKLKDRVSQIEGWQELVERLQSEVERIERARVKDSARWAAREESLKEKINQLEEALGRERDARIRVEAELDHFKREHLEGDRHG